MDGGGDEVLGFWELNGAKLHTIMAGIQRSENMDGSNIGCLDS